jgi:hypothetical protein
MTEQEQNEQQDQPENQDEEPVEEKDPELLTDREAMPPIGGETHGLGPPVP